MPPLPLLLRVEVLDALAPWGGSGAVVAESLAGGNEKAKLRGNVGAAGEGSRGARG